MTPVSRHCILMINLNNNYRKKSPQKSPQNKAKPAEGHIRATSWYCCKPSALLLLCLLLLCLLLLCLLLLLLLLFLLLLFLLLFLLLLFLLLFLLLLFLLL